MGINDYLQIGTKIKNLRIQKGYSAKDFAKEIGVPYSTYSNYENNNREPSLDVLNLICEKLEVSLRALIGRAFPVGENILWARKKAGLTVEEFCEKTGISKGRYQEIISGAGTKEEYEKASEVTGVEYKLLKRPFGFIEFYRGESDYDEIVSSVFNLSNSQAVEDDFYLLTRYLPSFDHEKDFSLKESLFMNKIENVSISEKDALMSALVAALDETIKVDEYFSANENTHRLSKLIEQYGLLLWSARRGDQDSSFEHLANLNIILAEHIKKVRELLSNEPIK